MKNITKKIKRYMALALLLAAVGMANDNAQATGDAAAASTLAHVTAAQAGNA